MSGGRIVAIEIKATAGSTEAGARHLTWLRSVLGQRFVTVAVLHTGPGLFRLGERITAIPICAIWGSVVERPHRDLSQFTSVPAGRWKTVENSIEAVRRVEPLLDDGLATRGLQALGDPAGPELRRL